MDLQDAEDGKKWVTLKYPDILPLMQKAKREETRKVCLACEIATRGSLPDRCWDCMPGAEDKERSDSSCV